MKLIKWITLCVAVAAVFFSCDGSKSETTAEPAIKITPESPGMMTSEGGDLVIAVFSNRDWTVSGVPEWMTVSPESGSASDYRQDVTITAEKNEGPLREAALVFAVEGASCEVKIKQNHPFGSSAPDNALYFESFRTGIGKFTIKDVNVPEQMSCVWEHSSDYKCMKGTAYSDYNNYESESWLISPDIDLTSVKDAYLTFEHAGGYFGDASNEATVWISKEEGQWDQLLIEDDDYPTSWTFITAGYWNLKQYVGNKVKVAFRYSSTATKAGTWEISNVAVVSGTHDGAKVPDVDPTKTQWMELPAMDNEAYGYYSHSFAMDGNIYRNYSFAWSQKDLVSVWVAYPLCGLYTEGNVGRTDKWAYDPLLKKNSSNPGTGYAGDYDRGHQLPSADRQSSRTANEQTFYGTNIAPQLDVHNTTIWRDLEDKVRAVAATSDTTYVVTGCVVDGATEFSTDTDNKQITIPVAFFKAVLRYKKGADAEWTAAGFYTEHKKYENVDLKTVAMSVDDLEKKTGLDFFVNLTGKVGKDTADAVEAQDPTKVAIWNL